VEATSAVSIWWFWSGLCPFQKPDTPNLKLYQHLLEAYGLVCIQDEWDQAEPIQEKKTDWLNRNKHAIEGRLKYPLYVLILGGYYTEVASWTNLPYKTQRNVGSWVINRLLVVKYHSMRWQDISSRKKGNTLHLNNRDQSQITGFSSAKGFCSEIEEIIWCSTVPQADDTDFTCLAGNNYLIASLVQAFKKQFGPTLPRR
jgi:hypothetical protein